MKDAENSKLHREISELKESIQDLDRQIEEQSQRTGIKEAALDEFQHKLDHFRKKAAVLDSAVTRLQNESVTKLLKAQSQRTMYIRNLNILHNLSYISVDENFMIFEEDLTILKTWSAWLEQQQTSAKSFIDGLQEAVILERQKDLAMEQSLLEIEFHLKVYP